MGWSPSYSSGAGAVSSVFTRTGAIVATAGDYLASQVTNAADKAAAATQAFTGSITSVNQITAQFGQGNAVALTTNGGRAMVSFNNETSLWDVSAGVVGVGKGANTLDGIIKHAGQFTVAILSGALPTVSPSNGTAFQCSTTRDVFLTVPFTLTTAAGTCLVQLSPDNVTFSTLITETPGVNASVNAVQLQVPAGWWVKLTVTNATLGVGTYY